MSRTASRIDPRAVCAAAFLIAAVLVALDLPRVHAALSCAVTTTCNSPNVTVLRLSSTTNAHAQLPSESGYGELVCCSGDVTLGTSCAASTTATVLRLSSTTNAQVEQNNVFLFPASEEACLSLSSGNIDIDYQAGNCNSFDTTILSISADSNAHAGAPTAYTTKVCGSTNIPQSLTFTISTSTVGFGTLSHAAARFATGNGSGNSSETEAHTIAVTTNAASGYLLSVQGATLTSGGFAINAIGATNAASSPGNEQFGLRAIASGGSGTVTSPYAAAGFAYAANATTTSQIASAAIGDGVQTSYSLRYIGNVAPTTEPASYATILTYAVTANF